MPSDSENNIPAHVAVIMDGNRRWAKKKGLPAAYGHKKGVDTVRVITRAAKQAGIKALTLYAFSCENWKRSVSEVKTLMLLLKKAISSYQKELLENDISLKFSGRIKELPPDIINTLLEAENKLKNCKSMVLNIALNYGGRQEILDAVNKICAKGVKKITQEELEKNLYTFPLQEPDLIIRTSGEKRISNFLLWQSAYSEFYFSDKFWPDFNAEDLKSALADYAARERRKGA